MKRLFFFTFFTIVFILECLGQEQDESYKFSIEVFPQVIFFGIYSAQFVYEMSEKDHMIIGITYLNNYYPNKENAIGQFYAPTIPIGYRRYLWKNLNLEGQLWPAYNFYKDLTQDKYYNGFDLAASIRCGYRFDFKIKQIPFYTNIQIEYLLGIYKGNKPANFSEVDPGVPLFPAISLGFKW